jgi:hypothetical protein
LNIKIELEAPHTTNPTLFLERARPATPTARVTEQCLEGHPFP